MALEIRSPAFTEGGEIPPKYTADGQNASPPLEWTGAPAGTRSLVVLMEDPDAPAGTFRHWALYDIMPTRKLLPEGVDQGVKTEPLGHGVNDFGHAKYDGPAPPRRHGVHHYHFRVAALDVDHLPVKASPSVTEVWEAAKSHVLDQAEIVGTYQRQ